MAASALAGAAIFMRPVPSLTRGESPVGSRGSGDQGLKGCSGSPRAAGMTPFRMGRTRKDSSQIPGSLLELVKRKDKLAGPTCSCVAKAMAMAMAFPKRLCRRRRFRCGSDSVVRPMTQSRVDSIKTAGQPEFSLGCNPPTPGLVQRLQSNQQPFGRRTLLDG